LLHQTKSSGVFDTLHVAVDNRLLDNANNMRDGGIPRMARPGDGLSEPTGNSAVYDALLALKPRELSLNAWTVKAGVGRSIFTEIRRHGNPTRETLEKLLGSIGKTMADLGTIDAPVRTEVRGTGLSPGEVQQAWAMPQGKPVPLLGTAFGSDLEEIAGIETTELMMSEVLDYLLRPPSLANDETAYAVTTIGDSMAPRYEPGEMVFVSPKATVSVGDDVLVQLRGEGDDDEASQIAGRISTVLLKRLVRRTGAFIELRQFNPDKTFQVPIGRVRRIHRVRGRL